MVKGHAGRLEGAQSSKGRVGIRQLKKRNLCVSDSQAQSIGRSRQVESPNANPSK